VVHRHGLTLELLVLSTDLSSQVANIVAGLSSANILTEHGSVGHLGRIGKSH
jgi:hypothetical protein